MLVGYLYYIDEESIDNIVMTVNTECEVGFK